MIQVKLLLLLASFALACGFRETVLDKHPHNTGPQLQAIDEGDVPPSPPSSFPWFERVFIIVLENQPLKEVIKDGHMQDLMKRGTILADYNALINPSQPNYFALTAGDTRGCENDEHIDVSGRFIVDLLEEKGISWKAYMEDYPGNCFSGAEYGKYRRKHNPFVSFGHVRHNATLCSKIVNAAELKLDVAVNALPRYSFYTPNMDNDGHDTSTEFASHWLKRFLKPLLASPNFMRNTLVVVTYDEGIKPDNKIYTLLLGDMVPSGHLDNTFLTHYSLLRLIEEQFSLSDLGRGDVTAPRIDPSNFYPGTLHPSFEIPVFLWGSMLGIFALCALAATAYYLRVVRKGKNERKRKARFDDVELEERGAFARTEAYGSISK